MHKHGTVVLVALLTACGGSEVAGTYVVTPTFAGGYGACQSCPQPNTTVYTLKKVGSKAYSIDAGGGEVIATYDESQETLDWTANSSDATSGCTEADLGHIVLKAGGFTGYLNATYTCGGTSCLCVYNLSASR